MFEVGEVVVCVGPDRHSRLEEGRCYRVTDNWNGAGVSVEGAKPPFPYDAFQNWRFRKLPKADQSFTDMIRACKPARVKEPA